MNRAQPAWGSKQEEACNLKKLQLVKKNEALKMENQILQEELKTAKIKQQKFMAKNQHCQRLIQSLLMDKCASEFKVEKLSLLVTNLKQQLADQDRKMVKERHELISSSKAELNEKLAKQIEKACRVLNEQARKHAMEMALLKKQLESQKRNTIVKVKDLQDKEKMKEVKRRLKETDRKLKVQSLQSELKKPLFAVKLRKTLPASADADLSKDHTLQIQVPLKPLDLTIQTNKGILKKLGPVRYSRSDLRKGNLELIPPAPEHNVKGGGKQVKATAVGKVVENKIVILKKKVSFNDKIQVFRYEKSKSKQ